MSVLTRKFLRYYRIIELQEILQKEIIRRDFVYGRKPKY